MTSFSRRVQSYSAEARRDRLYSELANTRSPLVGGCPHSTKASASPSSCSQCAGVVVERASDPRRVREPWRELSYRAGRAPAIAAGVR